MTPRTELLRREVAHKAEVDAKDNADATPLHWAAMCSQKDAAWGCCLTLEDLTNPAPCVQAVAAPINRLAAGR
jgi:ankyrin repeat protein